MRFANLADVVDEKFGVSVGDIEANKRHVRHREDASRLVEIVVASSARHPHERKSSCIRSCKLFPLCGARREVKSSDLPSTLR